MASKMKKLRKKRKSVRLERRRKQLRERVRLQKVLDGLGVSMTVRDIHHKTGMSERNIRKIMFKNSEEITFFLLKRENTQDKNK